MRLEMAKLRSSANFSRSSNMGSGFHDLKQNYTSSDAEDADNVGLALFEPTDEANKNDLPAAQIHTRHMSIDVFGGKAVGAKLFGNAKPMRKTGSIEGLAPLDESTPFLGTSAASESGEPKPSPKIADARSFEGSYSSSSTSTESSFDNPSKPMTRVKAAKYIILTLNQALMNSSFIIALGSIGFYYIEGMSPVDSFYFTTVLLTSVGYGDIVPVTTAGKVFATIFIVVAGTVLLNNMTLISMIPLELRKRRIESAVLSQFGDELTDDELRELSTGRLIQRLKLATDRPFGLEECTREMFSLAMLVRLGRITEEDVKATFAAFRRLDVGNYGKLNSRTIIEGQFMRRKSQRNLMDAMSPTESEPEQQWGRQPPPHMPQHNSVENMMPGTGSWVDMMHHGSPNPYMNARGHGSSGSFRRKPSFDSYYSQGGTSPPASSFDYDTYERFNHYSMSPSVREG
jgi:hypothetical protein